jgi:hypothetical protein
VLSLDSPRWAELTQAYGTGEDVPRLLDALATLADERARAEVWFALWRTLHRPGEAFGASYAAAPHLVAMVASFPPHERVEAVHLVTRIETVRRRAGSAPMPDDLVASYAGAVERLPEIVAGAVGEAWSPDVARIYAAALLAGSRQSELAALLLDAGREPDSATC